MKGSINNKEWKKIDKDDAPFCRRSFDKDEREEKIA